MKEKITPARVSAWQAALECQVTVNKIKKGLQANHTEPGKDGKYSLKDIVLALTPGSSLEQKAKEARFQRQIEEAELAKIERMERRDLLAPIEKLLAYAEDVLTKCVSSIRHFPVEQRYKDQAIALLRATEFNPTGKGGEKKS